MKKIYLPVFLLILLNFSLLSAESSVEIRADAFIHSSKLFRKIYGDVGTSYGIEASTPLVNCFDGWVNFDWFTKNGRSHVDKSEGNGNSEACRGNTTKVRIANFSFGLKFPYEFCGSFSPYVGIGSSLSRINIKNKSFCCHNKSSKVAFGGVVKLGIYWRFFECMFLDVFVDYLYQPIKFHKRVDVGGLKTGAGLGISF
ncbi:MAG TPA: hypothetical protein VGP47_04795 [Parachlamydiaceae bacterium]|nr:hypothetical protein [Parachlamydiaceae bacterium]